MIAKEFIKQLPPNDPITKNTCTRQIYSHLKSTIKNKFDNYLNSLKKSKAGRPRTFKLELFCDAFFNLVDSGSKMSSLSETFPTVSGSFKRYLKLFVQSDILTQLNESVTKIHKPTNHLLVDSFVVKSCDGSELTGKNYLDRGRKGVKVTIISDLNNIVRKWDIFPANKGETGCLESLVNDNPLGKRTVLADSGYIGKEIQQFCSSRKIRLVAQPRSTYPKKGLPKKFICKGCRTKKKCSNGVACVNSKKYRDPTKGPKMTHELTDQDHKLLKRYRNKVEHVNGYLRRFRGVNIKYSKSIGTYRAFVSLSILCNNVYQVWTEGPWHITTTWLYEGKRTRSRKPLVVGIL